MKKIKITEEQIYQIFLKWDKAWKDNPELYTYDKPVEELAKGQTNLFIETLNEMNNEKNIS